MVGLQHIRVGGQFLLNDKFPVNSFFFFKWEILLRCNDFFPQFPLNKLTELLRQDVAAAGFTEALTFALVCCARIFCPADGSL